MPKIVIDTIKDIPGFLTKTYSKILSKNPRSLLFVPLADVYLYNGMVEEAIDVCKKGIEQFPDYVSARVMLGCAYFEAEHFEESEKEFKKAEPLTKDNLLLHKMLYKIYSRAENLAAAEKELKKILRIYPEDKKTRTLLNDIEDRLGIKNKKKAGEPEQEIKPEISSSDGVRIDNISVNAIILTLEQWLKNVKKMQETGARAHK